MMDAERAIEIKDERHPMLEVINERLGERFMPNDVTIGGDTTLMILTGPNMAGQSPIMRPTPERGIPGETGALLRARRDGGGRRAGARGRGADGERDRLRLRAAGLQRRPGDRRGDGRAGAATVHRSRRAG